MKNCHIVLAAVFTISLLSGCSTEKLPFRNDRGLISFCGRVNCQTTKANYSGEISGGAETIYWSEGDSVRIFSDSYKPDTSFCYLAGYVTEPTETVMFTPQKDTIFWSLGDGANHFRAIYPYNRTGFDNDGSISITIPSGQPKADNPDGSLLILASEISQSDREENVIFSFNALPTVLELEFENDSTNTGYFKPRAIYIHEVRLESDSHITGTMKASSWTAGVPDFEFTDEAEDSVIFEAGTPVKIEPGNNIKVTFFLAPKNITNLTMSVRYSLDGTVSEESEPAVTSVAFVDNDTSQPISFRKSVKSRIRCIAIPVGLLKFQIDITPPTDDSRTIIMD